MRFGPTHGSSCSESQELAPQDPCGLTREGPVMPGNPDIFSVTWQPAAVVADQDGPMALRPRLATGLPLSKMRRPTVASWTARESGISRRRLQPSPSDSKLRLRLLGRQIFLTSAKVLKRAIP